MLDLTKIFLHNWHRFKHTTIHVQDSLYLAGHNGSGKSTILDAMQVILLADLDLIRFNSSTQERSERTLDGFVRGKIFETRMLRPAGCIGYIALEFTEEYTHKKVTLGCCIEASEKLGPNGARSYFILREGLNQELLLPERRPLTRNELKKVLQRHPGNIYRYYDAVGEYQTDMLDALGGLNQRFFDLFQRALSFKTIKDISEFVEQWLLPERPLNPDHLQKVVARLNGLHTQARLIEEKLTKLHQIIAKRTHYLRVKALQAQYEVLEALLRKEDALRKKADVEDLAVNVRADLEQKKIEIQIIESAQEETEKVREEKRQTYYGLDVVKRQGDLEKEIEDLQKAIEAIQEHRKEVIQGLYNVAEVLSTVQQTELLATEDEQKIARDGAIFFRELQIDQPPPDTLGSYVNEIQHLLREIAQRASRHTAGLEIEIEQLRRRAAELYKRKQDLETKGAKASYPKSVEILRNALEPLIGQRPPVLCEMIEVPDIRWQSAVEAMLGERRFMVIIPPQHYATAVNYLEEHKADRNLHDASILDLEKAYQEKRSALNSSLALQVTTQDIHVHAYLDSILGTIITCNSGRDLRDYRRAITHDLLYYNEWALRILPTDKFSTWFVGQRAQRSQIEACQREIDGIADQLVLLSTQLDRARQQERLLQVSNTLQRIQFRLEESLDESTQMNDLQMKQNEYEALDMSTALSLKAEIDHLDDIIKEHHQKVQNLNKKVGGLEKEQDDLHKGLLQANQHITSCEEGLATILDRKSPEIISEAERLLRERIEETNLERAINNAHSATQSYATQTTKAEKEHYDLAFAYNMQYSFPGLPDVPQATNYVDERNRLDESSLPTYTSQIQQTKNEVEQELREDILHKLRENIRNARNDIQRMNDALRPLDFHGDHYRFCSEIAGGREEYYHLIDDSQVIGIGALFESDFYQRNQEPFNRFYEEITRDARSNYEKAEQEKLLDYRTYLEYDIEVQHADGHTSRLSQIIGTNSGGETQTPFYLAIAASFVQLYRMSIGNQRQGRHGQPAIRLAVFDEAFYKMDQDRIGGTLDMFLKYHLQVVTATPLERCEYLVPKMCTNLVLTGKGDHVLIEEYRNYEARLAKRLEEIYGDGE